MEKFFQTKNVLWLLVLGSVVAFLGSLFAQFILDKQPCNLCIMQRVLVVSVGVVALVLALLMVFWKKIGKGGRFLVSFIASIPALLGAAVAIQQIYIQSLPADQVPACGSPLEFMLKTMPITDVIQQVLYGSGDCAKVETLMWIPISWWSLLFFSGTITFIWAAWFFVGRKTR